jgi:AraC family transcriptional regulator, transcriptional activator for feuABC-ybbA operon
VEAMDGAVNQKTHHTFFYLLKEITYDVQSPDWLLSERIVKDYTILIVTGGAGKMVLDGAVYALQKETCFMIEPNMTYSLNTEENGLSFYHMTFELKNVAETRITNASSQSSVLFPCHGEVTCTPFSTCVDLVEAIYEHHNDIDALESFHNHVRFQQLLLIIFRQNGSKTYDRDIRQAVKQSIAYVRQHYKDTLTVEELALIANIDRWRYTRLFKEMTGQVPLQYLNEVRINRAKELLLITNDRLYEIAQNVGFNNEYYFSRRFKQTVGISPSQFRRNHQESIRVFAPYLEDFLLALEMTPVIQSFHSRWGKQDYLALSQVPTFDITTRDCSVLSYYRPDFIVIDSGMERWIPFDRFNQFAPTYRLSHACEEWRTTLRTVADLFGKEKMAEKVILQYEEKAREAKHILSRSACEQTVACLRISANGVLLYASDYGYTGPILYKDLGLKPHSLVQKIPACTRFVRLTLDLLSGLDADHLFVTFDRAEGEGRERLNHPIWNSLPAVRNHCVYEVDFFTWMNYGVLSHHKKIEDVLKVLA